MYQPVAPLRILAVLWLGLAAALSGPDAPADELDDLRTLWLSGHYDQALRGLLDHLEAPYGRSLEVYYMIGSCACRMGESSRGLGAECFERLLTRYDLDDESRRKVQKEARICHRSERPVELALAPGHRTTSGTAGVSSKMFHWLDRKNVPLADATAKVVRRIDPDELRARLFGHDQIEEARAKVAALAGSDYQVVGHGAFVLASVHHSREELTGIGEELDRVAGFFVEHFGMARPRYLVSAYLTPSVRELRRLARDLHGIEITDSSIGYSYRDDMSLLGVIPGNITGTLKHELFHLMVRNNYGDIPPWLDEGMAALYEVSGFANGELLGKPNWRGPVLERYWALRPKLTELVASGWRRFHVADGPPHARKRMEKQAANHATARYFARWLQEQDRLAEVFRTLQAQPPLADPREVKTDVQVLEEILGRPLEQSDLAFADWFNVEVGKYHLAEREVRRYQGLLKQAGYDPKGADGRMGRNTRAAIRAFQADNGLTGNGELDLQTRKALPQ